MSDLNNRIEGIGYNFDYFYVRNVKIKRGSNNE
jgi:hypothetical protein